MRGVIFVGDVSWKRVQMIDDEKVKYIQNIRQFISGERGRRRYGWMPQTAHIDKLFVQPNLEVKICWQSSGLLSPRPSLCYYTIHVNQRGICVDMILEVDDIMQLIEMVLEIQHCGFCAVDTEAGRVDRVWYLFRDHERQLLNALRSGKSAIAEWCEEDEAL